MSTGAPGPWASEDLVRWCTWAGAGCFAMALGYWQASGRARLDEQLPWAGVAIAGLVVASCAHLLWVLRGRAAAGRRRLSLLPDVTVAATVGPAGAGAGTETDQLLAGPRLRHFHHPGCQLAAGRDWPAAPLQQHVAAGRRPCGVCLPELREARLEDTMA